MKNEKRKVSELQLSFRCIKVRTYYFLRYKKVKEDYYHTGYGSYDIDKVLEWEKECFEIVEKKETNADRIRNMPDEELARFIQNISVYSEDEEPIIDVCIRETHTTLYNDYVDILEWIQSEAE